MQTSRNVNATCVNNHITDNVVNHGPKCFNACPQPTNQSSACWIHCLFETLVWFTRMID